MAALKFDTKSAHCLIISANKVIRPYPVYPIGVAHVIGSLQHHGHTVDHVDILASGGYDELLSMLQLNSYDVIGVSIRNIDSVDSASPKLMLDDISEVITRVRSFTSTPIVLGGPGFSIMPADLLSHLNADYGIVGEGEKAFPLLIEKILSGENISEKLFQNQLDSYPVYQPRYHDTISKYYTDQGGMLNIQTKRGCNYGCTYCSYPAIEGKKVRYRDPDQVAEDVGRLAKEHGARYLFFTDGVFNDQTEHHLEIAESLIRSGNSIPWCAFFRPQNISTSDLRLLKKSGLAAMELGTDCATNETLSGIAKGFTFEDVITLNERIVAEQLPCAHFVMFGGPGETPETVREGISNLDKLTSCVVFAYVGLRILPGTKLYNRAIQDGVISRETDMISPVFYYSPDIDREYIDTQIRAAFKGKLDRIYPMEEMEEYVRLFHSMGHTGPLWDLMLHKKLKK